jgi:competence protein ComEC
MTTGHHCIKIRLFNQITIILLLVLTVSWSQSENIVSAQNNDQLTVTFIDVGQGDSSLLSTNGGIDILIDGGPKSSAKPALTYLNDNGVTQLDVMVISHLDADHIGGLVDVLKSSIDVDMVIYSGNTICTTNICQSLWEELNNRGLTPTAVAAGDTYQWGTISSTIINPGSTLTGDQNKDSVVMYVDFGATNILYTGDITETIEKDLVNQGFLHSTDILKVAHHGSKDSTCIEFLTATTPSIAVISVGENNTYGHPGAETLQRLNDFGAIIYRTDLDGDVVFHYNESDSDVTDQYQYIPLFRHYVGSSQTPDPMPGENVQCSTFGDVEICASVSDASPTQNSDVTVYGRLVVNGVPQSGKGMQTAWHYKSTTSHCDSGITDSGGLADCTRSIGRASIGYEVIIDVTIGGYSVTTSFTPVD